MSYSNEPPRDDGQFDPERDDIPEPQDDIPASVAFMEMMRRAAARSQPAPDAVPYAPPPPPLPADPPQRRRRPLPPEAYRSVPDEPAASQPQPEPIPLPPAPAANAPVQSAQPEVRRVRRRARRRQRASFMGGALRPLIIIPVAAVLIATILVWFTPPEMINSEVRQDLSASLATSTFATFEPTALPTANWQKRIGIVSGHRGGDVYDPGAVCTDAAGNPVRPNENDINFSVAEGVVNTLRGMGYTVDLLDEFDPRLQGYQAAALVSIHANTCREWPGGEIVSGFLIAAPEARTSMRGNDELLVGCVAQYYAAMTGLERRDGVTIDMTDYHNFREIHPQTPAAIIELGFLRADWELLTTRADLMSQAITGGILCFADPGVAPALPAGS